MAENTDIRQLTIGDEVFYPQTDINGLVNDGDPAIDETPTLDSSNLVTSGGVFSAIKNNAIYDISENNSGATYANLTTALADVPEDFRTGGMSVRFINSTTSKYVQYRLVSDTWSTTESDWQGIDDEPTAGSDNLVKSGGVYDANILGNQLDVEACANHTNKPMKFTSLLPLYAAYSSGTYTITRNANGSFGGIIIPVKTGETYRFGKSISNFVYTSSFPDVGVEVLSGGTSTLRSTTVPSDANYILITFAKSNLPLEIFNENQYSYSDGLKFFLDSGLVQNTLQYQSVYKAVLLLFVKSSIDNIYLNVLGGRNGNNNDCRIVIKDGNDANVVNELFTKDNSIKVIENDVIYAMIDTSKIIVDSGIGYYGFGRAFPINTKVKYPINAYSELNYLYNNLLSKAANSRFSVTTPTIVDRSNVQKVSFIASKTTGASDLTYYTLFIVDSTGTNSRIDTQKFYSFNEYHDIEVPSGYDELFFYNGKYSSEAFSIDVEVVDSSTVLAKANIITNNWENTFGYVYKELRTAGTHNRISWYIYLDAEKLYSLNVSRHYSDATAYDIYYEDSTGTNPRITYSIGCFFNRLYSILLPEGYDRIFAFAGNWNDTSGYEVEFEVTDGSNYFARIDENTEFSNRTDGLRNKTIVCFGDSITEFRNSSPGEDNKGYVEFLSEDYNCKAVRAGSGGARLAQRGVPMLEPTTKEEAFRAFDICNVVKAWCQNDWTYIDPARYVLEHAESPDDCSFIDGLKAVSPANVDVVTIFGGTNDYNNGSVIGTDPDSTDNGNVLGAINNIVSYLMTANPNMKVYFFTPIVRYFSNIRDAEHWSDNFVKDSGEWAGKTLPDACDIIVAQVKRNHIPCNNWYWNLGWNPQNFSNFFKDSDGTHPYKGFRWLASKIHSFVTSN